MSQHLNTIMNVNQKGVKGLIKVIDNLQESGYYTFPAFDDHSPIDLIAVDQNGKSYRLQVKYRESDKHKKSERYSFPASSVVNGKRVPIDKSMIDGWAVYLAEANKVVYIKKSMVSSTLTIDPSKDYGRLSEFV